MTNELFKNALAFIIESINEFDRSFVDMQLIDAETLREFANDHNFDDDSYYNALNALSLAMQKLAK